MQFFLFEQYFRLENRSLDISTYVEVPFTENFRWVAQNTLYVGFQVKPVTRQRKKTITFGFDLLHTEITKIFLLQEGVLHFYPTRQNFSTGVKNSH